MCYKCMLAGMHLIKFMYEFNNYLCLSLFVCLILKVFFFFFYLLQFQELEAAIRPDTGLISIMTVNNEIGVRQPVEEIGNHDYSNLKLIVF